VERSIAMLFLKAYLLLIRFDIDLALGRFSAIRRKVRSCPVADHSAADDAIERIRRAVSAACVWYRKEVLCLQRASTFTCLLRRNGVPAQMVIGAQVLPFRAHAWVEAESRVIDDNPQSVAMYEILDRC
jgi:Transglutaminase-like superfamily